MVNQIITYSLPAGGDFQAMLRKYQASAQALRKGAERINERAVRELSLAAQKNLRRRIRQRGRQQSRNQTLVDLAGDYKRNSTFSAKGFHFFVPNKVMPIAPYYRAIELGSFHMKGRFIPLTFFRGGTQVLPPSVRYEQTKAAVGQPGSGYNKRSVAKAERATKIENADSLRDYGTYSGRNGTPYVVQIRREIRPYLYISTAVDEFIAADRYTKIVEAEVRRLAPLLAKHMK